MNSFHRSCQFSNTFNQKCLYCWYYNLNALIYFLYPYFFHIQLMQFLVSPKGLPISKVNRYHRIARNLKKLFSFAGKPFSLILGLPILLIFLLSRSILLLTLFLLVKCLKRRACNHKMILSHTNKQTSFSEVIFEDENLVTFDKYKGIISSDLPHKF